MKEIEWCEWRIVVCKRCGGMLSRVRRHGLNRLFSLFGYYPWKCEDCYKVRLYHARGAVRLKAHPTT
jgi:hypothetical protein